MIADKYLQEHPEYVERRHMRQMYRDLYAGGEQLRANARDYLVPRLKEPMDVYQERLGRVFYENYVGSIIDWYAATLFRREPLLSFEGADEAGKRFYQTFAEDCDLKGTAIGDFMRKQFVEALVQGSSFVLLDFPRLGYRGGNRAEEDALGASRAYMVGYGREDLTNWSYDAYGNLEWAVIRLKSRAEGAWAVYDRENYTLYASRPRGGIDIVDHGPHALARQGRVPLFELKVSEGLWLMNKSALTQLEHFNKSNAFSWALTMGLFAMPVIFSNKEFKQVMGESYYLQLGPEDKFGWTEPDGKVYQIAADNLERLKDEIYRVCYLMTQAGGSLPSSGLSKQRDYAITQEILRAYGDTVKDFLKKILRAVKTARRDGVEIGVAGLDEFDIGEFSSELADAEKLLTLGSGSQTLQKQIVKRLAFKYLCDVRQEVKDKIASEIDEWLA